jgi:hypothetical protein
MTPRYQYFGHAEGWGLGTGALGLQAGARRRDLGGKATLSPLSVFPRNKGGNVSRRLGAQYLLSGGCGGLNPKQSSRLSSQGGPNQSITVGPLSVEIIAFLGISCHTRCSLDEDLDTSAICVITAAGVRLAFVAPGGSRSHDALAAIKAG